MDLRDNPPRFKKEVLESLSSIIGKYFPENSETETEPTNEEGESQSQPNVAATGTITNSNAAATKAPTIELGSPLPPLREQDKRRGMIPLSPLYLPDAKNIIVCDSQGKRFRKNLLDPSGNTKLCVVGGLTLKKCNERLRESRQPQLKQVENIVVFLGGNDLSTREGNISKQEFFRRMFRLLDTLKSRCPNAALFICDLLPREDCEFYQEKRDEL